MNWIVYQWRLKIVNNLNICIINFWWNFQCLKKLFNITKIIPRYSWWNDMCNKQSSPWYFHDKSNWTTVIWRAENCFSNLVSRGVKIFTQLIYWEIKFGALMKNDTIEKTWSIFREFNYYYMRTWTFFFCSIWTCDGSYVISI